MHHHAAAAAAPSDEEMIASAMKAAPKTLGNRTYRAQAKAPGTYVLAN